MWRWEAGPFGNGAADEDPDGNGQKVTFNLRLPGQYFDAETGLHYNGFRDYAPGTGRYIESDPVGLIGGINVYIYAENDPLSAIDFYGLKPGDNFKTIDATVIDAINYARTLPLNGRIEYGGWIYKNSGCYSYDEPLKSTPETGPYSFPLPPPRFQDVEWWHTHPDDGPSPDDFSMRNWDGNGRSGDQGVAEEYGRPGNLGTPSGPVKKLTPRPPLPPKITPVRQPPGNQQCSCKK